MSSKITTPPSPPSVPPTDANNHTSETTTGPQTTPASPAHTNPELPPPSAHNSPSTNVSTTGLHAPAGRSLSPRSPVTVQAPRLRDLAPEKEAEAQRYRGEMRNQLRRGIYNGAERSFKRAGEEGLLTSKTHGPSLYLLGYNAAFQNRDVDSAHQRLEMAIHYGVDDSDGGLKNHLNYMESNYGQVEITGEKGWFKRHKPEQAPSLTRADGIPFDPIEADTIRAAAEEIKQTGTFTGMLPKGEYFLGSQRILVAGMRPEPSRPKRPPMKVEFDYGQNRMSRQDVLDQNGVQATLTGRTGKEMRISFDGSIPQGYDTYLLDVQEQLQRDGTFDGPLLPGTYRLGRDTIEISDGIPPMTPEAVEAEGSQVSIQLRQHRDSKLEFQGEAPAGYNAYLENAQEQIRQTGSFDGHLLPGNYTLGGRNFEVSAGMGFTLNF